MLNAAYSPISCHSYSSWQQSPQLAQQHMRARIIYQFWSEKRATLTCDQLHPMIQSLWTSSMFQPHNLIWRRSSSTVRCWLLEITTAWNTLLRRGFISHSIKHYLIELIELTSWPCGFEHLRTKIKIIMQELERSASIEGGKLLARIKYGRPQESLIL